jgi:hypothetical protein
MPNVLLDGGVGVDLFLNGKYTCSSNAIYGDADEKKEHGHGGKGMAMGGKGMAMKRDTNEAIKTITSMTTCNGPFDVKKGDYMVLNAQYDLAKHPLRVSASGVKAADVMGMMGISFSPTN